MDGVDVALAKIDQTVEVIGAQTIPFDDALAQWLKRSTIDPGANSIADIVKLDVQIGQAFADASRRLLAQLKISPTQVTAIGSHGQNLFHDPDGQPPSTLQIGDPSTIAEQTGITVVADFRRRDVAAGGQGAPLAPALHRELFHSPREDRAVLNLGGIANLTLLPSNPHVATIGFDTGPANCLMDDWIEQHRQQRFDHNGDWARQGTVNAALLSRLLNDAYFARQSPKSTGREYFNLHWLNASLNEPLSPVDVQRTLLELTAESVAQQLRASLPGCQRLLVCGGGVHNAFLQERIGALASFAQLDSIAQHGADPDFIEATLFAWLAKQTLAGLPGNVASVTGAAGERILGAIYLA